LGNWLVLAHEAHNQLLHKAAVWAYIGSWDGCREMLALACVFLEITLTNGLELANSSL